MNEQSSQPKVFLSYASQDGNVADKIARALDKRGVIVRRDISILEGSFPLEHIHDLIAASDYLIVLLSPNTKKSDKVMYEMSTAVAKELTARDITILPVLIADVEIPGFLYQYQYLDCRIDIEQGIERLADQISAAPEIDFSQLTWEKFEDLVADLLAKLDFKNIEKQRATQDAGFDMKADYSLNDPFGVPKTETWLIQCKLYKKSRADVKTISQFLFSLGILASNYRGLLITNSQLTSVTQDHLAHLETKVGKDVRVIDGTELKRLLIKHKDLVRKYFLKGTAEGNEFSE
jgi:hypothetical protein